jgi:predicted transposase/invertase (TIGR01784 family)
MMYDAMPRYLDPTTDFGFKRLFGRSDSPESKTILKAFLHDILELPHPIAELTYIPQEQLPESPAERTGIYDIYCVDEQGNRFIVEMQRNFMRYYKERALFYATFPIIHQIRKGTNYDFSLLPVYSVNIMRYKIDEEPHTVRRIRLANVETGRVFYEGLTFVFVELPKFTRTLEQVTTPTERWLYLLKHLPEMEEIPPTFQEEPFPQAFEIARLAALSEKDREIYHHVMKRVSDEKEVLETQFVMGRETGRMEGRKEGEERGRKAGQEEGRKQEKREMARAMLVKGMDRTTVAEITGLSEEDLAAL